MAQRIVNPRRALLVASFVVAACGTAAADDPDEPTGFCVVSPKSANIRGENIGALVPADGSGCLKEEPYVCGVFVDDEFQRQPCE